MVVRSTRSKFTELNMPEVFDPHFVRGNGWFRDIPHVQENLRPLGATHHTLSTMPDSFAIEAHWGSCIPLRFDQEQTNSCVGQSWGLNVAYRLRRQLQDAGQQYDVDVSPAGVYVLAKKARGWIPQDSGSFIRDAAKMTRLYGVPIEGLTPFSKENCVRDLSPLAYDFASRHKVLEEAPIERAAVLAEIASGNMVTLGLSVYRSCWYSAEAQANGFVRLPVPADPFYNEGHAIVASWYDQSTGRFGGPNSWGMRTWGRTNSHGAGYWEAPLDYLYRADLSDDFRVCLKVQI